MKVFWLMFSWVPSTLFNYVNGINFKLCIYLMEEKSHDPEKKMESVDNNLGEWNRD